MLTKECMLEEAKNKSQGAADTEHEIDATDMIPDAEDMEPEDMEEEPPEFDDPMDE